MKTTSTTRVNICVCFLLPFFWPNDDAMISHYMHTECNVCASLSSKHKNDPPPKDLGLSLVFDSFDSMYRRSLNELLLTSSSFCLERREFKMDLLKKMS